MTTEKEFWEFTGRYFRTVASIKDVIDDLQAFSALPKDLRAIKSMKRIENIMKDFGKPEDTIIDERCVGCAGPCMVVDVAANLQKKLDECRKLSLNESRRVECDTELIEKLHREYCAVIKKQKTTIEELKVQVDAFPDNFFDVVAKRDEIIKQHETTIEELKKMITVGQQQVADLIRNDERMKETNRRYHTRIEDLKDRNIKDLHELYDLDKEELDRLKHTISARDMTVKSLTTMCQSSGSIRKDLTATIEDQKRTIDHFINYIGGLEAELSARKDGVKTVVVEIETPVDASRTIHLQKMTIENLKEGSAVLTNVHNLIDDWSVNKKGGHESFFILKNISELFDNADTPEVPPETPIDETPNIAIVFTYSEENHDHVYYGTKTDSEE